MVLTRNILQRRGGIFRDFINTQVRDIILGGISFIMKSSPVLRILCTCIGAHLLPFYGYSRFMKSRMVRMN